MTPRSQPEPAADPLADAVAEIDLRHRGELVGLLQVTTRPDHPLTREARALLRALATVAAAVVVADRDAADVRREVQDRLGPTLAGIGLGLQGVRNLVRVDPAAGLDLLVHLQAEVDAAAASVLVASLPLVGNDD